MEIAIVACCPSTHASDGSEHITPHILPASTALFDCSASQTITTNIQAFGAFRAFSFASTFTSSLPLPGSTLVLRLTHHTSITHHLYARKHQRRVSYHQSNKTNKQHQNACPLRDPHPLPPRERGPRTPRVRLPQEIRVHPQAGSHPGPHRPALFRGLHVVQLVDLVLAELRLPEDDALQEIRHCYHPSVFFLSLLGDATAFKDNRQVAQEAGPSRADWSHFSSLFSPATGIRA